MQNLPNWLKKSMLHMDKNNTKKGAIYDNYIQHDGWCNHFKGGVCNCDPNIRIVERKEYE